MFDAVIGSLRPEPIDLTRPKKDLILALNRFQADRQEQTIFFLQTSALATCMVSWEIPPGSARNENGAEPDVTSCTDSGELTRPI